MNTALTLWGLEISGKAALISILIYLAISIVLVIIIPRYSVPVKKDDKGNPIELTPDERGKLIEMRGKIRSAVIQVTGGIIVLAGFITTVQQIRGNEDAFNQKKADLFAKAVKELLSDESKPDSRAEAIQILSYVARSDRSYHRPVFDALSSYVTDNSGELCKGTTYRDSNYQRDRTIQLAMRIIGERNLSDDPTGKRFNLERGCFVGLDLHDEWGVVKGLSNTRLSGSKMLRVDLVKAELQGAELMGIEASDFLNPGWTPEIGRRLHQGAEGDPRKGTDDGEERRHYVAHFIDANLQNANFMGAGLQGADFSGADLKGTKFDRAVISRASFKGVQHLTAEQLKGACVGHPNMTEDELKLEQPYFSSDLRLEVKSRPDFENGIKICP
jgi:uncharacterized protein YjbI with pentapeptide repeats